MLLVVVAAVVVAIPEWRADWYQDDQLPVVFRVLHTDLAHHHGVAYPRLAPELGFGYGRLLHQFYPPLGVELAAWLHALGLGYLDATRATYSLCLIASALGMYWYGRAILRPGAGAVLAGVAYVWSPYLLLDAHRGGVLGESLALAIIPWTMLALHRVVCQGSWVSFGAAALGVTAINLAHNITALFFAGLAGLYVVWVPAWRAIEERRVREIETWRAVARGVAAIALGIAAASFYWAPALLELQYSNLGEQRRGAFSPGRYLGALGELFQPTLVFDYYSEPVPRYGLAAGLLVLAATALYAGALSRHRRSAVDAERSENQPDTAVVVGCVILFLVMLALQVRVALPVWERLPLVSFAQFPQRLFLFATFAGAVVLGTAPWSFCQLLGAQSNKRRLLVGWIGAAGAAVMLGISTLPGVWLPPLPSASHRITEDQVGLGTVGERRLSERSAYDDYFPAWVEERAVQVPQPPSANYAEEYRQANDGPVPTLRVLERSHSRHRLETEATTPTTVVFHQFYFPGWLGSVDGASTTVHPIGPLGLVKLIVPAGRHIVELTFVDTPVRAMSSVVSLIAALGILAAFARGLGIRRSASWLLAVVSVVAIPWAVHTKLSPIERVEPIPLNVDVTPEARLVAAEIPTRPHAAGDMVDATLIWQATAHTAADLQSGLRLESLDGGRAVGERWARPGRESTPTGKWVAGELIADPVSLRIPPGTPSGRYRLLAGLRDRGGARTVPIAEVDVR